MGGRSCIFFFKTPSYIVECIQVLCYGWMLPLGLFCFLPKHLLIFFSVYKSCVMGGRSRRGFLFSSKTRFYMFECIQVLCYVRADAPTGAFCLLQNTVLYSECMQVLCYGWTLPQGLFVFFKAPSYISEYVQVLCCGWTLPQGLFVFFKKRLIFLSVYKSCVTGGRSRRGFLFSSKTPSYIFECIQVLCYGWTLPQGFFSSKTPSYIFECVQVLYYGWTLPQGLFV